MTTNTGTHTMNNYEEFLTQDDHLQKSYIETRIKYIKKYEGIDTVPVIWHGEIFKDYYMDMSGQIYSTLRDIFGVKMIYCYNRWDPRDYPKACFRIKGHGKTIKIHRLVGHTLVPYTKPSCISAENWMKTPQSVKALIFKDAMELNHIDCDHGNYHPSNLEWSTRTENREAYHNHPDRKTYGHYNRDFLKEVA